METVTNWAEEVRRCFGDVTRPDRLADWIRTRQEYPIGSKVSGTVVLKSPFGVWLDLGVGFPALLLVTRFKHQLEFQDYVDHGPVVGGQVDAVVFLLNDADRQLVLTQKPLAETI